MITKNTFIYPMRSRTVKVRKMRALRSDRTRSTRARTLTIERKEQRS
jgi:hypothetical protein